MGFALLYFTGSDHFNRSMRYYAKQAFQLSLSDKELAPAFYMRVEGVGMQKQHNNGERIPRDSEQQIFDELGLEYKHPFERNCYDVRVEKRKEDDLKAEKRDLNTKAEIEKHDLKIEIRDAQAKAAMDLRDVKALMERAEDKMALRDVKAELEKYKQEQKLDIKQSLEAQRKAAEEVR